MSVDVQWTDTCPHTGRKRFVVGERFAGAWTFTYRYARREDWMVLAEPGAEVFETLLEVLDRRQQRGDAVTDADMKYVRKRLAACKAKPQDEGELL
jgi:hypothetical protein